MHALYHCRSSALKWGGSFEEYLPFHEFFDKSKTHMGDVRHRMWRHHSLGIEELISQHGKFFTNSQGKVVPVQYIGEQHVIEDLGFIPAFADWVRDIPRQKWMHAKPSSYRRYRSVLVGPPAVLSITCPKCELTSYHPKDVEHGYCGNCNEFWRATSEVTSGPGQG